MKPCAYASGCHWEASLAKLNATFCYHTPESVRIYRWYPGDTEHHVFLQKRSPFQTSFHPNTQSTICGLLVSFTLIPTNCSQQEAKLVFWVLSQLDNPTSGASEINERQVQLRGCNKEPMQLVSTNASLCTPDNSINIQQGEFNRQKTQMHSRDLSQDSDFSERWLQWLSTCLRQGKSLKNKLKQKHALCPIPST